MELSPLERHIKATAIKTIRKRFKDGIPESKARCIVFHSKHYCNGVLDEIFYDQKTGEFTVRYQVHKDPVTWKTENKEIQFNLYGYPRNRITIIKEENIISPSKLPPVQ